MKQWWMAILGTVVLATRVVAADVTEVKGAAGENYGQIVICNSCKAGSGATCAPGAEEGWLNGKPCGRCMIGANFGQPMRYEYDFHFVGTVKDPNGQPIKERFVKMFLPNGWGVRSRTMENGNFRLMLGATAERKGDPVTVDLGTLVEAPNAKTPYFALFFLPSEYKPCPENAVPARTPKAEAPKKGGKTKK